MGTVDFGAPDELANKEVPGKADCFSSDALVVSSGCGEGEDSSVVSSVVADEELVSAAEASGCFSGALVVSPDSDLGGGEDSPAVPDAEVVSVLALELTPTAANIYSTVDFISSSLRLG